LIKALRRLGLINDVLVKEFDDDDEAEQSAGEIRLPAEFERLRMPATIGNRRFWHYAARRHLTPELVREYRIGFCRSGRYAGRLIVPVICEGQLVSFVARAISDTEQKIMTPPGNQQSQYLFNLDRARQHDRVVVVEGVFDCLVLPESAVASLGKRLTDAQALLLVRSGFKRVSIAWDADAVREAEEAAGRLAAFVDARVVALDQGDPSELGRAAMLRAIAYALPAEPTRRVRGWSIESGRTSYRG
jgi:hypothetical protein